VAEFLSDEWLGELAAAAATVEDPGAGDAELVIEQVVSGSPRGDIRYRMEFGARGAVVLRSEPDDQQPADLVLLTDYATARRLHEGGLRAQDALAAGTLKVRGSPQRLARAADALAGLDAAFATIRAHTTFVEAPAAEG
jgi:hypothetical protein